MSDDSATNGEVRTNENGSVLPFNTVVDNTPDSGDWHTPPPQQESVRNTIKRDSRGRVLPGQKLRACGVPLRQLRQVRAHFVVRFLNRRRWRAICTSMYEIAANPANRQAVAAASWLSDRGMGPVAQQLQIEQVNLDLSPQEKRNALLARLEELKEASTQPSTAIDVTYENAMPTAAK
jgi:hypothetical protein